MTDLKKQEIIDLVENAKIAYVSSIDDRGYPNTKAMFALQHDDIFTHYFSTELYSRRAQQFIKSPKACVYFCDGEKGLMMVGEIEVLTDIKHKTMLWREGFEIYYKDGIATENYCVYKFTANRANYYYDLDDEDLNLEDFKNAKV